MIISTPRPSQNRQSSEPARVAVWGKSFESAKAADDYVSHAEESCPVYDETRSYAFVDGFAPKLAQEGQKLGYVTGAVGGLFGAGVTVVAGLSGSLGGVVGGLVLTGVGGLGGYAAGILAGGVAGGLVGSAIDATRSMAGAPRMLFEA